MENNDIKQDLLNIIYSTFPSATSIDMDTKIKEIPGLDSLTINLLLIAIEDKFELSIPHEQEFLKIEDIFNFIKDN